MSLDPEDWSAVQALGRRMVDDMIDYQKTVRDRPTWRPVPADVKARLAEPSPLHGAPLEDVYEAFLRDVAPYPTGNIHPRFWGWVMGTGSVTGMLAEMLAAGTSPQDAAKALGHADPTMTLNVYAHPTTDRLRAAFEAVSKALEPPAHD